MYKQIEKENTIYRNALGITQKFNIWTEIHHIIMMSNEKSFDSGQDDCDNTGLNKEVS